MYLDPATLIVIQTIGASLSAAILASSLYAQPSRSTQLALVSATSLMVGSLLLLLRGSFSGKLTIVASNVAIFLAMYLVMATYRAVSGRRWRGMWSTTFVALASVGFVGLYASGAAYPLRAAYVSSVIAVLLGGAAYELARDGGLSREKTRRFSFLILCIAVLSLSVRTVLLLALRDPADALLVPGLERSLAFVPGILIALGFGVGVLLMQYERVALEAQELAVRDALTGAFNRRALMRYAAVELAFARRTGAPCALIVLDIDHFKQVNDEHGHQAGDEVLRELASRMMQDIRPTDMFARIGGEEFCVLLRSTNLQGAGVVAERLRARVAAEPFQLPSGRSRGVTTSMGVTTTQGEEDPTWDSLFARADAALYEAKRAGRDRVYVQPLGDEPGPLAASAARPPDAEGTRGTPQTRPAS